MNMFKKKPEKADYKLLCHFLRGSAAAFSLFALESEGEFMALAAKFEANQATDDDRKLVLRILQDAVTHFRQSPDSDEKPFGLLEAGLLIQQMELELRGEFI